MVNTGEYKNSKAAARVLEHDHGLKVHPQTGGNLLKENSMVSKLQEVACDTRDGRKLAITTTSCTGLVTSCARLDILETPSVGPSSIGFAAFPETSKIYIDLDSWNKAQTLVGDTQARAICPSYLVDQVRQLRSQFHQPATYYLCRASSRIASARNCQPYTVFTYADHEGTKKTTDDDNSSMIASRMFQSLCYAMIKSPGVAKLERDFIAQCEAQCNESKMKKLFGNFLTLFGDKTNVTILYNRDSNRVLQQMAAIMSTDISRANHAVSENIKRRLGILNTEASVN